jgi:hypothetical protein
MAVYLEEYELKRIADNIAGVLLARPEHREDLLLTVAKLTNGKLYDSQCETIVERIRDVLRAHGVHVEELS